MLADHYVTNLRLLCSFERSVSDVCRSIGINRQQFGKYLRGTSRPSAFNEQRICEHFEVQPDELHLPAFEFRERMKYRSGSRRADTSSRRDEILRTAFPGDLGALRRYAGFYHSYFRSLSWHGYVMRTLYVIYEHEGLMHSKSVVRLRDPEEGSFYHSKYDGLVALWDNRIFLIEFQRLAKDAIVETILETTPRSELAFLRGNFLSIASRPRRVHAANLVWKFLGRSVDIRAAVKACGLLKSDMHQIDPRVVRLLDQQPVADTLP